MASDLQFTTSSGLKMKGASKILVLQGEVPKKLYGVDECFIGFAGNAGTWGKLVSWFSNTDDPLPKFKNMEFLMLTCDKKIYHSVNLTNWIHLKEKFRAIGSGTHFALGAMSAGKSPLEACKIAAKHDIYTGMGYQELSFE